MKKRIQRILCLVLTLCMLFSLGTEAFAASVSPAEDETAQQGFDFSASDYSVAEDGSLRITVRRNDSANKAAIVQFKVADILSDYGTDYIVLDAEGKELARVEGVKPDVSALADDDGSLYGGTAESVPEAAPKAGRLFSGAMVEKPRCAQRRG